MLLVFWPIFLVDTKIIGGCIFGASLRLITSQKIFQKISSAHTSIMLRAGFKSAQNLNSGFFELYCVAILKTTTGLQSEISKLFSET